MVKIKIKESTLKLKHKIVAKGKIGNATIVAMTGQIGDWAGYMAPNIKNWSFSKIANDGLKIFSYEIDKYFSMTKKVKEAYRR